MGGDLARLHDQEGDRRDTGDVPLTLNLFWLLTFPLAALVAFPALRVVAVLVVDRRSSARVLFSLAPYHFRNGAGAREPRVLRRRPGDRDRCACGSSARCRAADARRAAPPRRLAAIALAAARRRARRGHRHLLPRVPPHAARDLRARRARSRGAGPGRLAIAALVRRGRARDVVRSRTSRRSCSAGSTPPTCSVSPTARPACARGIRCGSSSCSSPVTGHRFGPFAAIADQLYERRARGLRHRQLGLAAAIGFVIARRRTVLVPRVRGGERRGWQLEIAARHRDARRVPPRHERRPQPRAGAHRAPRRARVEPDRDRRSRSRASPCSPALLDRVRVSRRLPSSRCPASRCSGTRCSSVVLVVGVLDQAVAGALMPDPRRATRAAWRADAAFVHRLERRLPHGAMVFQLPVVDFPEHGAGRPHVGPRPDQGGRTSTPRRCAGVRAVSAAATSEWQWPASRPKLRILLRGLVAMGFTGVMLDRLGLRRDAARHDVHALHRWLGPAVVHSRGRLLAWDLRDASPALLAGLDAPARARLRRQMLVAPRLYLDVDASPVTDRGDSHAVCRDATLRLVNPGRRGCAASSSLDLARGHSDSTGGTVELDGRRFPLLVDEHTPLSVTAPARDHHRADRGAQSGGPLRRRRARRPPHDRGAPRASRSG